MITADYVATMAAYNRWQNINLVKAVSELSDLDQTRDLGLFFKSIRNTCFHIFWGDTIWLSRFTDVAPPSKDTIRESIEECDDWDDYCTRRVNLDKTICQWADQIDDATLKGCLTYYSGAAGRDITASLGLLVTHFFNHQTHHRGQIHGMLTALGVTTEDTDIPLMPDL